LGEITQYVVGSEVEEGLNECGTWRRKEKEREDDTGLVSHHQIRTRKMV
jgi:hypothetical protein